MGEPAARPGPAVGGARRRVPAGPRWRFLLVSVLALLVAACASGRGLSQPPAATAPAAVATTSTSTSTVPPATVAPTSTTARTVPAPRPPVPTTSGTSALQAVLARPLAQAGCPVPPHPPVTSPPPWHPSVLVPDSALPAVAAPARWPSHLSAVDGTGMWIWQWSATEGGDAARVVAAARSAHLHQLWIRVGDSPDGFYGASELAQLVPAAHAAGLSVIAWGFPYLYDPVGDARWTAQILGWSAGGQRVDGYSADLEMPSEGVAMTAQRAAVYLEQVRRSAGDRLVVATVYPPLDAYWYGSYPYRAMAPYVDAFAPMIYWECTDPRADVALDLGRLAALRPVHVIGQAFDMADVGGRAVGPSAAEITAFLAAAQLHGALGGSFWVWQHADAAEWAAIAAYRWPS